MAFPLTVAEFRTRFPAFGGATPTDPTIQAVLDEAEEEIDEAVWGSKAANGHGLLTAHKLAMEPFGRDARLAKDDTQSTYGVLYEKLARDVGGSYPLEL